MHLSKALEPYTKQHEFYVGKLIPNKYGFKETKERKKLDSRSFPKWCYMAYEPLR